MAAALHALSKSEFTHLAQHADGQSHVMANLNALPGLLFEEFAEAANGREWILGQLPHDRASTVLHGDLLPQNLLFEDWDNRRAVLLDWECAWIGDPAYDLAIVTRSECRAVCIDWFSSTMRWPNTNLAECRGGTRGIASSELVG